MGFGMIYLPSVVIITDYFKERLSFANGVASCGGGVGTFAFAPIMHLLDDEYGWEYTLVIFGLIMIICFPLGALCQPLKTSASTKCMACESKKWTMINCQEVMKYCKGILLLSTTKKGKSILILLKDAKCCLFMLSNFLTCMGAVVPFVFTVVSTLKITWRDEFKK